MMATRGSLICDVHSFHCHPRPCGHARHLFSCASTGWKGGVHGRSSPSPSPSPTTPTPPSPCTSPSPRRLSVAHPCRASQGGDGDVSDELDVSIFRFTLGIPGFDDSQIPRVLGLCIGALLLVNHLLAADVVTSAQMRSEAVGIFLSVVATNLPSIGELLKGQRPKKGSLKKTDRQVFLLSRSLSVYEKEELAWLSYTLLKNTNTIAVAIWHKGLVCARGCWEIPGDQVHALEKLESSLKKTTFLELTSTLYLPTGAGGQGLELVPEGASSLLVEPFNSSSTKEGYVILVSRVPRAYGKKDRLWTGWFANKLAGFFSIEGMAQL